MGKNKKSRKNNNTQNNIANDQLGANEIDRDLADKYSLKQNKKKNKFKH